MAGPCLTEADAHAAADAHDLAMGEVTLEELERQRPSQRIEVAWQVSHDQAARWLVVRGGGPLPAP